MLPLVLGGLLVGGPARGLAPGADRTLLAGLLGAAALLFLCAALGTLLARARLRRAAGTGPLRPGLLGPTLLIPAIGAVGLCFLLSLLLTLTDGTLRFAP